MRVACPECAAEYDLPPAFAARLSEGRTLRCARCGITWAPQAPSLAEPPEAPAVAKISAPATAPASAPAAPAAETPAPGAPATPTAPVPALHAASPDSDLSDALAALFVADDPPPRSADRPQPQAPASAPSAWATAFAWTGSILLLFGAAAAAWHWRFDLVEAWPPAVRAFIALGLAG
jgi:hypothetical protein